MEVFKGGCLKQQIRPIFTFFLEFFPPLPDTTTPWMRLWFSGSTKVVSEGDYCIIIIILVLSIVVIIIIFILQQFDNVNTQQYNLSDLYKILSEHRWITVVDFENRLIFISKMVAPGSSLQINVNSPESAIFI